MLLATSAQADAHFANRHAALMLPRARRGGGRRGARSAHVGHGGQPHRGRARLAALTVGLRVQGYSI